MSSLSKRLQGHLKGFGVYVTRLGFCKLAYQPVIIHLETFADIQIHVNWIEKLPALV